MTPLLFTSDKQRLLEHFRKDPVLFAYHLGDLDDFYFDDCQWGVIYGHMPKIEECVMLYYGSRLPTLLAFGLTDRFPDLLSSMLDILPKKFFCHYFAKSLSIIKKKYTDKPLGIFQKMVLKQLKQEQSNESRYEVRRLNPDDQKRLLELYDSSYSGHYFTPRMLATGKYFGCFKGEQIVSATGVHVYSREFKIAVLGNIATHSDFRGYGLAAVLSSELTNELVNEGLTVCLNVKADNRSAIRCYEKIGFVHAHTYEESLFESAPA